MMEWFNLMKEYLQPELGAVPVVLCLLGSALKRGKAVRDEAIPLVLTAAGIFLALLWTLATLPAQDLKNVLMAVFTAVVQGVLGAGMAVYCHQLYKQRQKARQGAPAPKEETGKSK